MRLPWKNKLYSGKYLDLKINCLKCKNLQTIEVSEFEQTKNSENKIRIIFTDAPYGHEPITLRLANKSSTQGFVKNGSLIFKTVKTADGDYAESNAITYGVSIENSNDINQNNVQLNTTIIDEYDLVLEPNNQPVYQMPKVKLTFN